MVVRYAKFGNATQLCEIKFQECKNHVYCTIVIQVSHSVILCRRKRIKQIRSSGLWNGNVQFFNPQGL